MSIENTTARMQKPTMADVIDMSLGGVERQEARGQQQLAEDSALPVDGLDALPAEWGIVNRGTRAADPLFADVTLPNGWKVQPTAHAMWSDLVDGEGKKRAAIFYKAAFYDRKAFIRPVPADAPPKE